MQTRYNQMLHAETSEEQPINEDAMAHGVQTTELEVVANEEQVVNDNSTTTTSTDEAISVIMRESTHDVESVVGEEAISFWNTWTLYVLAPRKSTFTGGMNNVTGVNNSTSFLNVLTEVIDRFNRFTAFHTDVSGCHIKLTASVNTSIGSEIPLSIEKMSPGEYVDFILAGGKASIANTDGGSKLTPKVPEVILSSGETMSTPNETYKDSKATIVDDDPILNSDSPIVQSVFINSKPGSYAGAVGASSSETKKGKANFCPLQSENLCDGVELTIPLKFVEAEKSSFSRCLIEVKADDVLKDSFTMGIYLFDGSGFSKETEEWKIGYNNNSTNRNGVKIGGQSVKPNFKYVPKASVCVPQSGASKVVNTSKTVSFNAPTILKSHPSKASGLPSSSSGSLNGKNGGTNAKEKATSPYNSSNIPVSNLYALLDEESDE
ncbi:hypothetical protein Tco_0259962 [Tanacetum coccineum]